MVARSRPVAGSRSATLVGVLAIGALAGACFSAHRSVEPASSSVAATPVAATSVVAAAAEEAPSEQAPSQTVLPQQAPSQATLVPDVPPALPPIAIHKGTRVLMFGDSMVTSGLGIYLKERVVALGGTFVPVSKGNSTTLSWRESSDIQDLIARTRPDVVVIALAANELFVPNPRARSGDIRAIVKRVGARPCLWIGPPPWLPEKGILGVIRESSTPCRFYDSSSLVLERQRDGIHPTLQGGKAWADAVWNASFASD